MARTYKITDGTLSVDLLATGATGFIPSRGGLGPNRVAPTMNLVQAEGFSGGGLVSMNFPLVTDTWTLYIKGSSANNVATQLRSLLELLILAARYHTEPRQNKPVYIETQMTGETNLRYSLVYGPPELVIPDQFDFPLEGDSLVEHLSVQVVREPFWRSAVPGVKGTALILAPTDGPTTPTAVHISNAYEVEDIAEIKVEDNGTGFTDIDGANDALFPATVAQNDALYSGNTNVPPRTIVIPKLQTKAVITTSSLVLEYYKSAAWTELVLGTDYTCYPGPTLEDCFEQNDVDIVINIKPPSDWITLAVDGDTCYWVRIRESNASPSWGTVPVGHATYVIYSQQSPVVEIPSTAIKGDVSPYLLIRLISPSGGDDTPSFASTSRILIGLKSRGLTKFVSHLNTGGDDNPADWTATQLTDATATADVQAPGGKHSAVSFSTDSTLTSRVRLTGDNILDSWVGEYRAFLRVQQVGGSGGDCNFLLRTFVGGYSSEDPHTDSAEVPTVTADDGIEVLDMGVVRLPFAKPLNADTLSGVDVIFEVLAERNTGSSTLKIYDLILIPIDEWVVGLDDPLSDVDTGGSALRGSTALDVDGGVIAFRTSKMQKIGGNWILSENWARMGPAPTINDVETKARLYFIIMHYEDVAASGNWGQAPFFGDLGAHLSVEIYGHMNYVFLRGSD
jgi:hypothetical protein